MAEIIMIFYSWAILAVVPKDVAEHPKRYIKKFNKWLNREDSPYYIELENGEIALDYNEEAFIIFLNELFVNEKSYILEDEIHLEDKKYLNVQRVFF